MRLSYGETCRIEFIWTSDKLILLESRGQSCAECGFYSGVGCKWRVKSKPPGSLMSLINLGPLAACVYWFSAATAAAWLRRAGCITEHCPEMLKITLIMCACTSCWVCLGEKNACSCWRTKPAITNSAQLTWKRRGSDQFHKDTMLFIRMISAASMQWFRWGIFLEALFWEKIHGWLFWGGKKAVLYKHLSFYILEVLREVRFLWRLC